MFLLHFNDFLNNMQFEHRNMICKNNVSRVDFWILLHMSIILRAILESPLKIILLKTQFFI